MSAPPAPLPADIEDAIWKYGEAVGKLVWCDSSVAVKAMNDRDALHAKLTALLSGHIKKAEKWDTHERDRKTSWREAARAELDRLGESE